MFSDPRVDENNQVKLSSDVEDGEQQAMRAAMIAIYRVRACLIWRWLSFRSFGGQRELLLGCAYRVLIMTMLQ